MACFFLFRLHTFGHQTAGNQKTQTMVRELFSYTLICVLCIVQYVLKRLMMQTVSVGYEICLSSGCVITVDVTNGFMFRMKQK